MDCSKKIKELRESTGMNRREFCDYFDIPYRTVTDWELGNRQMPEYLLRLMKYKVEVERLKFGNSFSHSFIGFVFISAIYLISLKYK